MLIDFFYTLRSAKLPVSVKEYLTLMEALKAGVVGPTSDDSYKIDDFYYLSRTALVKDEKHYDKFDRAFAAYFKGVEMVTDFTKEIPADWLRKLLDKESFAQRYPIAQPSPVGPAATIAPFPLGSRNPVADAGPLVDVGSLVAVT